MQTLDDIDAHRRAAFNGLIDRFQHSGPGMLADEDAAARALEGSVYDEGGGEVRLTMRRLGVRDIMERVCPAPRVRHPFHGANRQQRRAAEARARRRA